MKCDNALIIGARTPTDAEGNVNRVCGGQFVDVYKTGEFEGEKIYLSDLGDETLLGECIDYCIERKPQLIVHAGFDLYDSGVLEARYHMSPIMYLHKIGLLNERCSVVGGICFDRDDAFLMADTGASLIVCPTYSCGTGRGIPLVTPAKGKVKVRLGTFDNRFNVAGDIALEAAVLYLGTCSVMRKSDIFTFEELAEMAGATDADQFIRRLKIKF